MSSDLIARHRATRLLGMVITPLGVTTAVVLAASWVAASSPTYTGWGAIGAITLLMVAVAMLVIGAHEGGHFMASRLVGFRTISLTIGPLRFVNRRGGLHVRSAEGWQLAGGMLVCVPIDGTDLRRRWMWVVAAGPTASLLLSLAAWLVVERADLRFGSMVWLSVLFPTVAVVSAIAFVGSLLPSRKGFLFSDGSQLLLLARGGAGAERWCAQIMLAAAARGGVRPRDWNREWLSRATALQDDSAQEAIGHLATFYHTLDLGDAATAAHHLACARALSATLPPRTRALVELDAAYFEARVRGNLAGARAALGRTNVKGIPPFAKLRSEAALLLLEGDRRSAARKAREGLDALAGTEHDEMVRFPAEEEWLRGIVADAEREAAVAAP
jgi:hypothetical protein